MSTIHRRPLLLAALLALLAASHTAAATLVVANKAEATASLVDLETGEVVATVKTGQGPHEVGISPDGTRSVPIGVVIDAEGRSAFVAHANADVITEVDLEKGEITRLLTAGREPDGMGWSSRTVKKR